MAPKRKRSSEDEAAPAEEHVETAPVKRTRPTRAAAAPKPASPPPAKPRARKTAAASGAATKKKAPGARKTTKKAAPVEEAPAEVAPASPKSAPKRVRKSTKAEAAAAEEPAAADKEPTRAYGFGGNCFGQLGISSEVDEKKRPTLIGADDKSKLHGMNVVCVAAGGMHSACVTDQGQAFTWGCGDDNCLGRALPDEDMEFYPGSAEGVEGTVVAATAGDSHTALLTADGHVFVTGTFRDSKGIIGFSPTVEKQPTFARVYDKTRDPIVAIAAGSNHVLMLSKNGRLLTFGVGEQGQLGRLAEDFQLHKENPDDVPEKEKVVFENKVTLKDVAVDDLSEVLTPAPVPCKRGAKWAKVFAGSWTSYAIDSKGKCWGWGLNNFSQLGFKFSSPTELSVVAPHSLSHWDDLKIVEFALGQHHVLALSDEGRVYSCGRGDMGRLGLGNTDSQDTPQLVAALADKKIVSISCATCVSYAIDDKGVAYAWGFGENQQLASGSDEDLLIPTAITGKSVAGARVLQVSGGGQHTLLVATVPPPSAAPAAAVAATPAPTATAVAQTAPAAAETAAPAPAAAAAAPMEQ